MIFDLIFYTPTFIDLPMRTLFYKSAFSVLLTVGVVLQAAAQSPTTLATTFKAGTAANYSLTDLGDALQLVDGVVFYIKPTGTPTNRTWNFNDGSTTYWRPSADGTSAIPFNTVIRTSSAASAKLNTSSGGFDGKITGSTANWYTFNISETDDSHKAVLEQQVYKEVLA